MKIIKDISILYTFLHKIENFENRCVTLYNSPVQAHCHNFRSYLPELFSLQLLQTESLADGVYEISGQYLLRAGYCFKICQRQSLLNTNQDEPVKSHTEQSIHHNRWRL